MTELCLAIPILLDNVSIPIVSIALQIGHGVYPLDSRVTSIQDARLESDNFPLDICTMESILRGMPHWPEVTGRPNTLVTNYTSGHILVIPEPIAADTLLLRVSRTPLYELDYTKPETEIPEIPAHLHAFFIPGITALAYRKADAEAENLQRSMADESEWLINLERMKRYFINLHGAVSVATPHWAFV